MGSFTSIMILFTWWQPTLKPFSTRIQSVILSLSKWSIRCNSEHSLFSIIMIDTRSAEISTFLPARSWSARSFATANTIPCKKLSRGIRLRPRMKVFPTGTRWSSSMHATSRFFWKVTTGMSTRNLSWSLWKPKILPIWWTRVLLSSTRT